MDQKTTAHSKSLGSFAIENPMEGIVIGRLVRAGTVAEVLVDYPGNPSGGPLAATSIVESFDDDVGRDVALAFHLGDAERPMVLGFIQQSAIELGSKTTEPSEGAVAMEVKLDDERLVLTADKEIVLKCGKASITLTKAGKVLIRGKYVLSRSSGVNRIKGGSVQIN